VPFSARERALATNAGRPLDNETLNSLRQTTTATHPLVKLNAETNNKAGAGGANLRPARAGKRAILLRVATPSASAFELLVS